MKNNMRAGLLLILLLTSSLALAVQDRLPDGLRLRRMSLLLRGYLPSPKDIAELKATPESAREEFFQAKLRAYTSDVLFRRKFAWRTQSLFRLQQNSRLSNEESLSDFTTTATPPIDRADTDSTDALTKLLGEEKSWDDLMSSPAFAYQRELRIALEQAQGDSAVSRIAAHYEDLAPLLGDKNDVAIRSRIRAHLTGEKPITIQEIVVPKDLRDEASTWADLLDSYDIDVEVNTRTTADTINTFHRLDEAFSSFDVKGREAVRRFQDQSFSFFKPDFNRFFRDRDLIDSSSFRRRIRVFKNSSEVLSTTVSDVSEIILRSSVVDRILEAAEDVYLYEKKKNPAESRFGGPFRSL
ncbi:MAG: hypothetical protein AB7G93_22560 [Bdellovibrionales bacterium]